MDVSEDQTSSRAKENTSISAEAWAFFTNCKASWLLVSVTFTGLVVLIVSTSFYFLTGEPFIGRYFSHQGEVALTYLALLPFIACMTLGGVVTGLARFRNEESVSLKNTIERPGTSFRSLLGAVVLYLLAVGAGLVLFVIPGLILALFMLFAIPIVVCEDTDAWSALKKSLRFTYRHRWVAFRFLTVTSIKAVVLFIPVFLGTFIGFTFVFAVFEPLLWPLIGKPPEGGCIAVPVANFSVIVPLGLSGIISASYWASNVSAFYLNYAEQPVILKKEALAKLFE